MTVSPTARRYATLTGIRPENAAAVRYTEGDLYDSVSLGSESSAVVFNSVVLLPGLISPSECAALVTDVERRRLDCALEVLHGRCSMHAHY